MGIALVIAFYVGIPVLAVAATIYQYRKGVAGGPGRSVTRDEYPVAFQRRMMLQALVAIFFAAKGIYNLVGIVRSMLQP